MSTDKSISPFASMLLRLLDETELFSRSGWGDVLSARESMFDCWVNDVLCPPADKLRGLVGTVIHADGNEDILAAFFELCRTPSRQVSPLAEQIGTNVGCLYMRPLLEGLERRLATYPIASQEQVLEAAISAFDVAERYYGNSTGAPLVVVKEACKTTARRTQEAIARKVGDMLLPNSEQTSSPEFQRGVLRAVEVIKQRDPLAADLECLLSKEDPAFGPDRQGTGSAIK